MEAGDGRMDDGTLESSTTPSSSTFSTTSGSGGGGGGYNSNNSNFNLNNDNTPLLALQPPLTNVAAVTALFPSTVTTSNNNSTSSQALSDESIPEIFTDTYVNASEGSNRLIRVRLLDQFTVQDRHGFLREFSDSSGTELEVTGMVRLPTASRSSLQEDLTLQTKFKLQSWNVKYKELNKINPITDDNVNYNKNPTLLLQSTNSLYVLIEPHRSYSDIYEATLEKFEICTTVKELLEKQPNMKFDDVIEAVIKKLTNITEYKIMKNRKEILQTLSSLSEEIRNGDFFRVMERFTNFGEDSFNAATLPNNEFRSNNNNTGNPDQVLQTLNPGLSFNFRTNQNVAVSSSSRKRKSGVLDENTEHDDPDKPETKKRRNMLNSSNEEDETKGTAEPSRPETNWLKALNEKDKWWEKNLQNKEMIWEEERRHWEKNKAKYSKWMRHKELQWSEERYRLEERIKVLEAECRESREKLDKDPK